MASVLNLASGGGVNADKLRPVGTIYQSTNATNPAQWFGGTWQRYGNGRVAVGLNTADADFKTVSGTGGAKTHVLTAAQMPVHSHSLMINAATLPASGNHTHNIHSSTLGMTYGDRDYSPTAGAPHVSGKVVGSGAHSHAITPAGTVGNAGSGAAHSNLMPYMTVYAWKRVA